VSASVSVSRLRSLRMQIAKEKVVTIYPRKSERVLDVSAEVLASKGLFLEGGGGSGVEDGLVSRAFQVGANPVGRFTLTGGGMTAKTSLCAEVVATKELFAEGGGGL
jgi:hypothetical protein